MMSHGKIRIDGFDETNLVAIEVLKAHPKNPNKHSEEQLAIYAAILEHQGVRQAVRVSAQSGFVTKGHGQILASQRLGWTHVPVEVQEYDSPEQEYADLVADNALAKQAEIDYGMVNAEMAELGPDFDLSTLAIPNFTLDPSEKLPPPPPTGSEQKTPSGEAAAVTKIILFYTQNDYTDIIEKCSRLCVDRGYADLSAMFRCLVEEALAGK